MSLTESADLWYGGAGATQARGTVQGFVGRASGGDDNLATTVEFTAKVQLTDVVNLHFFCGDVFDNDVIENNFADDEGSDLFVVELTLDF